MATVTRSTVPATSAAPAQRLVAAAPQPIKIALPTQPRVAVHDLNRIRMLITGEPGTGKTMLGLQESTCFNLTFDPLRETYGGMQVYVPDWQHFLGYLKLVDAAKEKGTLTYKRIQVDGADIMYRHCQAFACKRLGVEHPADAPWGKGFDAVNTEFAQTVDRLLALLPTGVWFTCHAKEKEIEKADGRKVQRLSPILKGSADETIVGKCDMVMNIQYRGNMVRVGRIRGDETVSAKCDVEGHFLTADGRQVQEIVLGNKGAKEAYRRLQLAYDNKLTYTTYEEAVERQGKGKATDAAKSPQKEEVVEEVVE